MSRATAALALISTVCFFVCTATAQGQAVLFQDAPPPAGPARGPSPAVVRERLVTIDYARLRGAQPAVFVLNLFPDVRFNALQERVETTSTGYVWVGHLQGVADGAVTLAVTRDVMSGSITAGGIAYSVRYVADGVHAIQQLDQTALPPELPPVEAPPAVARMDTPPPTAADDGSQIDLLVFYTPAARTAQGGTAAMESLIDLGVSETNQAIADGGSLYPRVRLVGKQEISYVESGSMSTDLSRLANSSDGFMDTAHTLRNTYGADLVQVVENSPDACGIAYLMTTVDATFAPYAFSVTHYSCISPNYSFGHELGHNMGLRHDTYVDSATTPYAYSHGYVNPGAFVVGAPTSARWRDIMAYNNQCAAAGFNCTRLRYFSNPLQLYNGSPLGDAATADCMRVLGNTRTTVANFRAAITTKRRSQVTSQ